jgi:hypothetical protein
MTRPIKARIAMAAAASVAALTVPAAAALATTSHPAAVKPAATPAPGQLISICLTIRPNPPLCIVL